MEGLRVGPLASHRAPHAQPLAQSQALPQNRSQQEPEGFVAIRARNPISKWGNLHDKATSVGIILNQKQTLTCWITLCMASSGLHVWLVLQSAGNMASALEDLLYCQAHADKRRSGLQAPTRISSA